MTEVSKSFLDANDPQIYPALAVARATCPVPHSPAHGRNPLPRRNVTRWVDVERVLRDNESFSSRPALDDIPHTGKKTLIGLDGDEHRRFRSLIKQAFTPAALRVLERDLVEPLIRDLLIAIRARGHAELVSDVIRRFPVQVICRMLGVPVDRMEDFQRWGTDMILGAYDEDAAASAAVAMTEVLRPIVEDRRLAPRQDLISQLVTAELDGESLDDEALYSFLRLLLPAGADTTWRALGSTMVALLENPAELTRVSEDRALIPEVIEESLRWESPAPRLVRMTTIDVEIAGCPVEAGTVLEVWPGSANRDESRFDKPDEWRPGRDNSHISFGVGPHVCLGINLARTELRVGLNAMLDELPGLRLDPAYPPPVITGHALRGPSEIHVLFDPAPGH
jgi:cytochrome P450